MSKVRLRSEQIFGVIPTQASACASADLAVVTNLDSFFKKKKRQTCKEQIFIQITEDSYYVLEDLNKHDDDDEDTILFRAGHLDMFCLVSRLDEFV